MGSPPLPLREALGHAQALVELLGGGRVRMVPPDQIRLDPARFQFRCDHSSDGTTGRLKAQQWRQHLAGSLLCWVDPADGRCYLVDGHHRLALSLRCQVPAVAVLLLEAATAREARLQGAAANVAAGQADAAEVARWLAAGGSDAGELEALGVSRRSRLLVDARKLQRLCPSLLALVCRGLIPEAMGLALAQVGGAAVQRDLWRQAQRRGWSAQQTAEAARLGQLATVRAASTAGVIPGLLELMPESSNLDQLLAIRAEIRRQLGSERRLMQQLSTSRAQQLVEGNDVGLLDPAAAGVAGGAAAAVLVSFDRLAGHSSRLDGVLMDLAAELARDGGTVADLVRRRLPEVRDAIEREILGPQCMPRPET